MSDSEIQEVRQRMRELIGRSSAKPIATRQVELAFQNRLLRVEENHVLVVATGAEDRRVRIAPGDEQQQLAVIVPVLSDGRMLLVFRYRYAPGRWSLEFPRGTGDANDGTWKQIVQQKLAEETGTVCARLTLLGAVNGDARFMAASTVVVAAENCEVERGHEVSMQSAEEMIAGTIAVTAECLNQLIREGAIECALTLAGLLLYRTAGSK